MHQTEFKRICSPFTPLGDIFVPASWRSSQKTSDMGTYTVQHTR